MFRKYYRALVVAAAWLVFAGLPATVGATILPIPTESGWNGFVIAGAGYTDIESNTVAGNKVVDFSNENVSSLTASPDDDDTAHFSGAFEVRYTFGDQWQAFLGTSLLDRVTLDFAQQLGLRKQTDNIGTFQAGLLFSGIPSEVWEDPYQTDDTGPRNDTDRDAAGIRLQWDRIFGSGFEATLSFRDIDIDKERIGQNVTDPAVNPCNATCQSSLERDGDSAQLELAYLWELSSRTILRPAVRFNDDDRDGDAQDRDGYTLSLTWGLDGDNFRTTVSGLYNDTEYDNANPIYGIHQDADGFVINGTLFYDLPTESRRWKAVGSITYGESDSDIDFHDNELLSVTLGVMYNFGNKAVRPRGTVIIDN